MAVDGGHDIWLMRAAATDPAEERKKAEGEPEGGAAKWGVWGRAGCSQRNFWHSVSFERRPGREHISPAPGEGAGAGSQSLSYIPNASPNRISPFAV
jgi:hypothetical protein